MPTTSVHKAFKVCAEVSKEKNYEREREREKRETSFYRRELQMTPLQQHVITRSKFSVQFGADESFVWSTQAQI